MWDGLTVHKSQWLPQNASDLAAYATILASLVTLLLFAIAIRQLRLLRSQVEVASGELDAARLNANAAQTSANAAIDAAHEAAKMRVDAHAPRLVVDVELIPGALADQSRRAMPGANELRLLDSRSLQQSREVEEGEEFIFDRDAAQFVWFRARGTVRNEGHGTCKVRLDGEAHFDDYEQGAEVVFRPGDERRFLWGTGFSAGTLAQRGQAPQPARGFLIITATSYDEAGVIDRIFLELASRALQPVPGNRGAYAFRGQIEDSLFPPTAAVVYPLQRVYRWDWDAGLIPEPPWPADELGEAS